MNGKIVTCDKCGEEYSIGDFPFCGKGGHGKPGGFDEPLTPYVDIQLMSRDDPRCDGVNELGMRGVTIYSRSQRRQLMKEFGLQFGTQKFDDRGRVKYVDLGRRR